MGEHTDLARELRDDYPAVDVTSVIFSRDFAGIGCCVIPQDRVLAVIKALDGAAAWQRARLEQDDAVFNEREALVKALEAMCGYLLNAKIDLETGCTKATAIKTIEGGIKQACEALAKVSA